MSSTFRRLIPVASVLLGSALAPLALAHPALVRSTPAADASVAPTAQIELAFNEPVMPRATQIQLSMGHGNMQMAMPTSQQQVLDDGRTLRATFKTPLPAGSYTLQWRAVGQDSHPMTGSFAFTVK
ncbi:copper homeostasis periplasmic binding protein CopC [Stenotrophomonas sp. 24(2023)]|uniref:copper homeostasis periplasmic binding protein CopC n=1 Tax=Stenotrophomonas sp. 24(2023) TaxID=3068324 RepID=UPI0027DFA837|nr:copper homeostasis periplasmic binding protein CopC [Stenotrophomonas sp. 24(2023)]WMJ69358.1 copper homeostasis periplasmic binding protein CopC [Stenotrophomonas sp. 24(2023)]